MKLFRILFVALCLSVSAYSQSNPNTDVYIYAQLGERNSGCIVDHKVSGPAELNKYRETGKCGTMPVAEYIDFEKFSIITYRMTGDCKISGKAEITLNRRWKLYTVHLTNYRGRCRAGGSFSGWLQIDRIPQGFGVEFEEYRVEGPIQKPVTLQPGNQSYVTTSEADLKGCVWLGLGEQKQIANEKEYLEAIRQDAQTESCESTLPQLDFAKYSYIGVNINSGYCGRPAGLSHSVTEYGGSRTYEVRIKFTAPGETCRALSKYDLWIRIPKSDQKYTAVVRINQVNDS